MQTLQEDLKNGKLRGIYLLYGEEDYLKKQYREKIKKTAVPDGNTMNETIFRGGKIEIKELISVCETMPFFAERRLIIVEDSGLFEKASEELNEYLPGLPETTCLLFLESKVDKRGRLYKFVKKNGYAAEFSHPDNKTLQNWILKKMKQENKKISRGNMEYLMSLMPGDMNSMNMELEKLFCYTMGKEIIEKEDLDDILSQQVENRIFKMISAISSGEEKQAFQYYYELVELKEAPLKILALLVREFRILYNTKIAAMQGIPSKKIAELLHMNPYIMKHYVQLCAKFEPAVLKRALRQCAKTEEEIKTGKTGDRLGVELLIIQLLGIKKMAER